MEQREGIIRGRNGDIWIRPRDEQEASTPARRGRDVSCVSLCWQGTKHAHCSKVGVEAEKRRPPKQAPKAPVGRRRRQLTNFLKFPLDQCKTAQCDR